MRIKTSLQTGGINQSKPAAPDQPAAAAAAGRMDDSPDATIELISDMLVEETNATVGMREIEIQATNLFQQGHPQQPPTFQFKLTSIASIDNRLQKLNTMLTFQDINTEFDDIKRSAFLTTEPTECSTLGMPSNAKELMIRIAAVKGCETTNHETGKLRNFFVFANWFLNSGRESFNAYVRAVEDTFSCLSENDRVKWTVFHRLFQDSCLVASRRYWPKLEYLSYLDLAQSTLEENIRNVQGGPRSYDADMAEAESRDPQVPAASPTTPARGAAGLAPAPKTPGALANAAATTDSAAVLASTSPRRTRQVTRYDEKTSPRFFKQNRAALEQNVRAYVRQHFDSECKKNGWENRNATCTCFSRAWVAGTVGRSVSVGGGKATGDEERIQAYRESLAENAARFVADFLEMGNTEQKRFLAKAHCVVLMKCGCHLLDLNTPKGATEECPNAKLPTHSMARNGLAYCTTLWGCCCTHRFHHMVDVAATETLKGMEAAPTGINMRISNIGSLVDLAMLTHLTKCELVRQQSRLIVLELAKFLNDKNRSNSRDEILKSTEFKQALQERFAGTPSLANLPQLCRDGKVYMYRFKQKVTGNRKTTGNWTFDPVSIPTYVKSLRLDKILIASPQKCEGAEDGLPSVSHQSGSEEDFEFFKKSDILCLQLDGDTADLVEFVTAEASYELRKLPKSKQKWNVVNQTKDLFFKASPLDSTNIRDAINKVGGQDRLQVGFFDSLRKYVDGPKRKAKATGGGSTNGGDTSATVPVQQNDGVTVAAGDSGQEVSGGSTSSSHYQRMLAETNPATAVEIVDEALQSLLPQYAYYLGNVDHPNVSLKKENEQRNADGRRPIDNDEEMDAYVDRLHGFNQFAPTLECHRSQGLVGQPIHTDVRADEEGNTSLAEAMAVGFVATTDSGLYLQLVEHPDGLMKWRTVDDLENFLAAETGTMEGRVVFIPKGVLVIIPAHLYHGGNLFAPLPPQFGDPDPMQPDWTREEWFKYHKRYQFRWHFFIFNQKSERNHDLVQPNWNLFPHVTELLKKLQSRDPAHYNRVFGDVIKSKTDTALFYTHSPLLLGDSEWREENQIEEDKINEGDVAQLEDDETAEERTTPTPNPNCVGFSRCLFGVPAQEAFDVSVIKDDEASDGAAIAKKKRARESVDTSDTKASPRKKRTNSTPK